MHNEATAKTVQVLSGTCDNTDEATRSAEEWAEVISQEVKRVRRIIALRDRADMLRTMKERGEGNY